MKNKILALGAAILLATGVVFSFVKPANPVCAQSNGACCDMPCPAEGCPIPCCDAGGTACTR